MEISQNFVAFSEHMNFTSIELDFSNLAFKSFNFIEKSDLGGRKPGLHGSTKMSTTGSINMVGILIEGSTFKGAEWNLVSHKFCLFPSSSCKYQWYFVNKLQLEFKLETIIGIYKNKGIRAKILFFGIVSWIQPDNSNTLKISD